MESQTAPDSEGHVQEVIEHISNLNDEQIEQIRTKLNTWHLGEPEPDDA